MMQNNNNIVLLALLDKYLSYVFILIIFRENSVLFIEIPVPLQCNAVLFIEIPVPLQCNAKTVLRFLAPFDLTIFAGKEYAKADSRWGSADPTIVSLEIITVLFNGSLCVLLIYAILFKSPYRYTCTHMYIFVYMCIQVCHI